MEGLRSLKMVGTLFCFCVGAAVVLSAQTFTTLVNFDDSNGAFPDRALVQGIDGRFYGTTEFGGAKDRGTVFTITSSGTLTTLSSFYGKNGKEPTGIVLATNGNLYGTTYYGGLNGGGSLFRITPQGYLTSLYSFGGLGYPSGPLIQGDDGNFYGTTVNGGVSSAGTMFKMAPNGTLTTLYTFCSRSNCGDGELPFGPLVQGTDGNFYGTTFSGGARREGTVFRITPSGTLGALYNFCSQSKCADGHSAAGLIQASDGNFYGTTNLGGSFQGRACAENGCGTVFKITPTGMFTTLYTFCSEANCSDGIGPGPLVEATDGNFYGTTGLGGTNSFCPNSNGCGTIFRITPSGEFTTLYTACSQVNCADGNGPGGLVQASDGNLYGATGQGGANNFGTVFSFSLGFDRFVKLGQESGKIGQTGAILGQGFTEATGVAFNGIPASFTVVSDTYIQTTVPAGSTTGFVSVTTPSGTLTSNVVFRVK